MSNFSFLSPDFPDLERLGRFAEIYLFSDPHGCLTKMGLLGEILVTYMVKYENIQLSEYDATQHLMIKHLKHYGLLPPETDGILYQLRKERNIAAHNLYESTELCKTLLQPVHQLCVWFVQTYVNYKFEPAAYRQPGDIRKQRAKLRHDHAQLQEDYKKLSEELEQLKAASVPEIPKTTPEERRQRSAKAAAKMQLSEEATRLLIDEQLRKVGWEADTVNLRYANGTRPQKGKNIAIAEWPTDSAVCKWGAVDYALFAGLTLVGVVEAKPAHKNISSVIDNQCRDYSMGIRAESVTTWGAYKVPFLFATNGRPHLKQLEIKSGIWFRDARSDSNIPKPLKGWFSPQGMLEMLDKDIAAANQKLADTSFDLLTDKDGLNLRPYQLRAVEKAEEAVINGSHAVLLAMATGTGKTRTALGMIYRFLEIRPF